MIISQLWKHRKNPISRSLSKHYSTSHRWFTFNVLSNFLLKQARYWGLNHFVVICGNLYKKTKQENIEEVIWTIWLDQQIRSTHSINHLMSFCLSASVIHVMVRDETHQARMCAYLSATRFFRSPDNMRKYALDSGDWTFTAKHKLIIEGRSVGHLLKPPFAIAFGGKFSNWCQCCRKSYQLRKPVVDQCSTTCLS